MVILGLFDFDDNNSSESLWVKKKLDDLKSVDLVCVYNYVGIC